MAALLLSPTIPPSISEPYQYPLLRNMMRGMCIISVATLCPLLLELSSRGKPFQMSGKSRMPALVKQAMHQPTPTFRPGGNVGIQHSRIDGHVLRPTALFPS